ncbi:MAG: HD domain-containing protein [Proteobacteria bacterium]|nr:HD domain-containing protein [Pseudomonadota bacterium]
MNPIDILTEFYDPESTLFKTLVTHSRLVAKKALHVAGNVPHLKPDLEFIEEACLLHDIGIYLTHAPQIGCYGANAYILHGYLGGNILKEKGLNRHAMVCERHPGTGISAEAIKTHQLDLPERDMLPVSIEEQIICFADKFYSKTPESLQVEKSVDDIVSMLSRYGNEQSQTFLAWLKLFGC